MAALISSVMDTKDKVPWFVNQAEAMGIAILPPDVNLSDHEFVVVDGNIRFGLDAVKGVGHAAVEAIKAARADGPFTSLWDFCERVDARAVNKKAIEALIKCGAFGSTGASRKGMLAVLESAQAAGQKAQLDAQIGQGSIFDLGGFGGEDASPFAAPSHPPIPSDEFERGELLAIEKESIGLFITEHPLKRVRDALRLKGDTLCADVPLRRDGDWVRIGGMISASKKIKTRSGSTVMFATLDDLDAQVELLVFEKVIMAGEAALQPDQIVLVRGTVDHGENGRVCVKVADVTPFDPSEAEIERARDQAAALAAARAPRPLHLRVEAGRLPATVIDELKRIFGDFPGESEVVLEVHTRTGHRKLRFGEEFRVAGQNAALRAELHSVLGEAVLPAVASVA
jgi:DNA polymerase-3 subunit alpha